MTDYERYKRRVELAEAQGWTETCQFAGSGSHSWIPPGSKVNRANVQMLPSLEALEKAAKEGKEAKEKGY